MKKIGFWEAAFKDINGWERRALNEAAESLAQQDQMSTSNAYGLQKLFALDRAQANEIAHLRAAVEIMSALLVEHNIIDRESFDTRLQDRLAEIEAANRPKQMVDQGAPDPVVSCSACGEEVFARQTQITARGTICDACYYKLQG